MTATDIQTRFQLTENEMEIIQNGVLESKSLKKLICCRGSDCEMAKRILEEHSFEVIQIRFGESSPANASALANYLFNEIRQIALGQKHLLSQGVHLEEIIDRAPFGDGTNLPLPPKEVILYLLNIESVGLRYEFEVWQKEKEQAKRDPQNILKVAQKLTRSLIEAREQGERAGDIGAILKGTDPESDQSLYEAVQALREKRRQIMKERLDY